MLVKFQFLPKHYWEDKNFEETTLDIPIGSGPYKIKDFDAGRSITYELDNNYWGLNIRLKKVLKILVLFNMIIIKTEVN